MVAALYVLAFLLFFVGGLGYLEGRASPNWLVLGIAIGLGTTYGNLPDTNVWHGISACLFFFLLGKGVLWAHGETYS